MVSISLLIKLLSYAIALCGILPLFPWLDPAPRLIVLSGLSAGLWQDLPRGRQLIRDWILTVAAVLFTVYYGAQFSRATPVQPVVSLLAAMLSVRLAGSRSSRHYLQTAALALFCLASSSLFDLRSVFLVYLIVLLFLVALMLVLLAFYDQDSDMRLQRDDLRRVLAAGLALPLISLPLLVFFFPILPRTQLPLWNFLNAPAAQVAGMSDAVEPGSSSSQATARTLAFRAESQRLGPQQLYWRGTVFNRIDGRRWSRVTPPGEEATYGTIRIRQTIYPEPGASRVLLALDAPARLTLPRVRRQPDGIFEHSAPAGRRFSYDVESDPAGVLKLTGVLNHGFYLQLPHTLPPRIAQLAASIRAQGNDGRQRLELVEQFFRSGAFRYSRTGLPTGEKALETFLFEARQGHCEFFASSFALLLRASGVPARLVGGYLGGEYNQTGGYYLVTEDLAHVWVEVYLEGQGWLRVDPSALAVNADAVWAPPRRSLAQRVRLALDSLDHGWNRAVIAYDFEQQYEVARSVGNRISRFEAARLVQGGQRLLIPVLLVVLPVALFMLRHRLFPGREERLLRRFYRVLARDCSLRTERGRAGLFSIAEQSGSSGVREFVDIYAGAVYRDRRVSDAEYRRLKEILAAGFVANNTKQNKTN